MSGKPPKGKSAHIACTRWTNYFSLPFLDVFLSDTNEPQSVQLQLKRSARSTKQEKKRATRCAAEKRKVCIKKNTHHHANNFTTTDTY